MVDKVLNQLLWELGGYQTVEFQIVNSEKEEIVFVDKNGELFLCLVESNKPSKAAQSACLAQIFKRFRLICCFFNVFKLSLIEDVFSSYRQN